MSKIHQLADVQTTNIGEGTNIWQFCVVLKGAQIGTNCNISCHVLIEGDVIIGDHVTVKSGVQIWDGLRVADHVFIGPNVTFTNDLLPRSKQYPESFSKTFLNEGCSIGANATLVAGNTIGKYAMVGAGSVVTSDVENFALVYGNPARKKGYVTKKGEVLNLDLKSKDGRQFKILNEDIIEV